MVSICLVLDCSYSMKDMPSECIEHVKSLLYKLKEVDTQCTLKLIEFGSEISYQEIVFDEPNDFMTNRYLWRYDMGMTALYDTISFACNKCSDGGLMIIVTDGEDTCSSTERKEAMADLETFRKGGKVHLVGVGSRDELMEIFNGQVDEIYAIDPNTVDIHNSLSDTISSQEFLDSAIESIKSLRF